MSKELPILVFFVCVCACMRTMNNLNEMVENASIVITIAPNVTMHVCDMSNQYWPFCVNGKEKPFSSAVFSLNNPFEMGPKLPQWDNFSANFYALPTIPRWNIHSNIFILQFKTKMTRNLHYVQN